jgi:hypothetical protein
MVSQPVLAVNPEVRSLKPVGGRRGTEVEVTLTGQRLADAKDIVFYEPGIVATIDNAAAEQAVRPLCIGRRNWLHLGGDGGLRPTAVLLSVAASVKRHGIDPWAYLTHVLSELPGRTPGADLADLLPDAWDKSRGGTRHRAG